jgi:hypothetical protein
MRFLYLAITLLFSSILISQNSELLEKIIANNLFLNNISKNPIYKTQIIFTQINRDVNNNPKFSDHYYNLDSSNYFYCASLVKLPVSIFALEKLNGLKIGGLTRQSFMITEKDFKCQTSFFKDNTSESGFPTLENYIKKMFLVSDNFSYSRVFEFVTPNFSNNRLNELGYQMSRIVTRFDSKCSGNLNLFMNPINFLNKNRNILYRQKSKYQDSISLHPLGNKLIFENKDFSNSNFISLSNIHSIMKRLIFHNYLSENQKFKITNNDWEFLVKHLGMLPRESNYPFYDSQIFHDSFKKYFIFGKKQKKIEKDSIRVFNIVGCSYGFLIDCAYIVNYTSKIEFMISTVIYTNKMNRFDRGSYEYEKIGLPYLKELSLNIYEFELKREKQHLPNLQEFNFFKQNGLE